MLCHIPQGGLTANRINGGHVVEHWDFKDWKFNPKTNQFMFVARRTTAKRSVKIHCSTSLRDGQANDIMVHLHLSVFTLGAQKDRQKQNP